MYCSSVVYPSRYANRIQTLSTAQALYEILGDRFVFGACEAQGGDLYRGPIVNFFARRSILLAWRVLRYIRFHRVQAVYAREYPLLFMLMLYNLLFFRMPLRFYLEEHVPRFGFRFRFVMRRAAHVFCLTRNLQEVFAREHPRTKTSVLPDGVRQDDFEGEIEQWGGLPSGPLVTYVGSVGTHDWKGVDVLIEAASFLKEMATVVIAGAHGRALEALRAGSSEDRVHILPWLGRAQVASLMRSSAVLVLPNKTGNENSERFTSPLKLFEYMASGTPIVASDLPSIREILADGRDAVLVSPDDPVALAHGIDTLLRDSALASALAVRAREESRRFSWSKRAEQILAVTSIPDS
jgi:glycosyltransferase involved in cell wall biosynthesis